MSVGLNLHSDFRPCQIWIQEARVVLNRFLFLIVKGILQSLPPSGHRHVPASLQRNILKLHMIFVKLSSEWALCSKRREWSLLSAICLSLHWVGDKTFFEIKFCTKAFVVGLVWWCRWKKWHLEFYHQGMLHPFGCFSLYQTCAYMDTIREFEGIQSNLSHQKTLFAAGCYKTQSLWVSWP